MVGSVQGSAIDDSFEFLPDTPNAWVSGVGAQARVVDYQYTVEPGDARSAIDDRCPTEYGPYATPSARPIIRPAARVSTSPPIQPTQSTQPVTDQVPSITPRIRSSRTKYSKKRPSANFVIRGKNGETRVMNNPFIHHTPSETKKPPTHVPETHDEGSSNKDTSSSTTVRPPGFKIRIKGKNGEETIREFKTPFLFPSASSRVANELHSDDTTVVADDSISVKNQRTAHTVQTPVRSIRHAAATTRLPTIEERSGKSRASDSQPQPQPEPERVIKHAQHEKSVSPAPVPSIMSIPFRMSGALPPASSTATSPPRPVQATTLAGSTPTAPLCPLPTAPPSGQTAPATHSVAPPRPTAPPSRPSAPPSRPANSSLSTPIAPSPVSTRLPPSKPTGSLFGGAVQGDAIHGSFAPPSNLPHTPSELAAALEALNKDPIIPESLAPVNTTSERSSLHVPSDVTWNDVTQHHKPSKSAIPTKISNVQSGSTQQSVRSSNSSQKPTTSETRASSNATSPRPTSEADTKAGSIDHKSRRSLGSQNASIAESWKSKHHSKNGTVKLSQVATSQTRSSSACDQQAETISSARVSPSISIAAGEEQRDIAQPQSKPDDTSQHDAWNRESVENSEIMPSESVSQISSVKGSGRSRHPSQKERSVSGSPSSIDALAVQNAGGWETIPVPTSRNSDHSERASKLDERSPFQPSSIPDTTNTRMFARSNYTFKSGEHLSNRTPSMIDAISCQGSVAAGAEENKSQLWGRQSSTFRQNLQADVLNTTATSLKALSQISSSRMSRKSRQRSTQDGKSESASPFSIVFGTSQRSEQGWRSALPSDAERSQRSSCATKKDNLLPVQDLSTLGTDACQAMNKDWKSVSSLPRKLEHSSLREQRSLNYSVSGSDTAEVGASQSSRKPSKRFEQPTSQEPSRIDTATSKDENRSWKSASLPDHKPSSVSETQQNVSEIWDDAETGFNLVSRTSAQATRSGGQGAASPDSCVDASEKSQDQKDWMDLTSKGRGQLELVVSRQSYYRWKRPSDSLFSSSDRSSRDTGKDNSRSSHKSHAADGAAVDRPISHTPPRSELMPWWDALPPPSSLQPQQLHPEQQSQHCLIQERSSDQLESRKSQAEHRSQYGSAVQVDSERSQLEHRSQHGSTQEGSSIQGGVRLSQYGSPKLVSKAMAGSSSHFSEPSTTFSQQPCTTPSGSVRTGTSTPPLDDRASRISRSSHAGSSRHASGGRSTAGTRSSSTTPHKTDMKDEQTLNPWDEQPIHVLDTIYERREPSSRSQVSTYSEQRGSTKYARLGDVTPHPLSPAASNYAIKKPPTQEPAWKKYRQPYMEPVYSETQSSDSRWYDDSSSGSGVQILRGRSSDIISRHISGSRDSVEAVLSPRTREMPVMDEQANEDWRSVSSKRTSSAIDALNEWNEEW